MNKIMLRSAILDNGATSRTQISRGKSVKTEWDLGTRLGPIWTREKLFTSSFSRVFVFTAPHHIRSVFKSLHLWNRLVLLLSFSYGELENWNLQASSSGSFVSPLQRERGKEDPGSGWSLVLVTTLCSWEGSQLFRILSPFWLGIPLYG